MITDTTRPTFLCCAYLWGVRVGRPLGRGFGVAAAVGGAVARVDGAALAEGGRVGGVLGVVRTELIRHAAEEMKHLRVFCI
jgi:hypothetical protein